MTFAGARAKSAAHERQKLVAMIVAESGVGSEATRIAFNDALDGESSTSLAR